ncbi:hypothetical protein J6590_096038 [Homalodisca vitripennis]|nr:hypothetical protein J6590_096038 [Homalodisca vitripennis]
MAQCSGYNGYRKITASSNVERGCCLDCQPLSDPVLASRPHWRWFGSYFVAIGPQIKRETLRETVRESARRPRQSESSRYNS